MVKSNQKGYLSYHIKMGIFAAISRHRIRYVFGITLFTSVDFPLCDECCSVHLQVLDDEDLKEVLEEYNSETRAVLAERFQVSEETVRINSHCIVIAY